jgi:hypothetical protein
MLTHADECRYEIEDGKEFAALVTELMAASD